MKINVKDTVEFNYVHPHAAYISLLSSNIYEYLSEIKETYAEYDLVLKTMKNEDIESYLKFGFIECRRTYEEDIDISKMLLWLSQYESHAYNNNNNEFELNDQLVDKAYEVYRETHRVNPVRDLDTNEWRNIIEPDLDIQNSIVIRDVSHNIIAFMLIYNSTEDTKDVGHLYYDSEPSKQQLYQAYKKKLVELSALNFVRFSLEVDNTDRYSYDFFKDLLTLDNHYLRTLIYSRDYADIEFNNIDSIDITTLYRWSKDQEFCSLNGWPSNQSLQDITTWWQKVIDKQSTDFKRYIISLRKQVIGYYDELHHDENTIELGIAIGEQSFRNKSVGSLIFSKITKETSLNFPLKRIIATVDESNIASKRMMSKTGFVVTKSLEYYTERNELAYKYIN